ncbi:MAG: Gfo/Idh/MocA family oxidoreductase [Armatimonadetes bacterium]|nr:Gfo/Idh/MocA family oxidoreductase [Armatimonadota bacterium]
MASVGIGIIGSQFAADLHAQALAQVPGAAVVAVASPTAEHARAFAERHGIPRWFTDYREVVTHPQVDVVSVCAPNDLHAPLALAAAEAGKHVIVEKPLCLNLEEAEAVLDACRRRGVLLMYAEQLCFAPRYQRMRRLIEEDALGRPYLVRHVGKHFGPHSAWFWDVSRSGGGAFFDMGCHGLELARWLLGKPRAMSVFAHMATRVHGERTRGEDDAVAVVEFEGGATAIIEASWARPGGLDDRVEIYGTGGHTQGSLHQGGALLTYSLHGYGYAGEKSGDTQGWTFTVYDEIWNGGYVGEMAHFIRCIRHGLKPLETGEDGLAVLELCLAAYESARTDRKVALPFLPRARRPIDLLLGASAP